jgi:hypothetical protein
LVLCCWRSHCIRFHFCETVEIELRRIIMKKGKDAVRNESRGEHHGKERAKADREGNQAERKI